MVLLHSNNLLSLKSLFDHVVQSSGIVGKDHGQTIGIILLSLKTLLDHDMQSSGIV